MNLLQIVFGIIIAFLGGAVVFCIPLVVASFFGLVTTETIYIGLFLVFVYSSILFAFVLAYIENNLER